MRFYTVAAEQCRRRHSCFFCRDQPLPPRLVGFLVRIMVSLSGFLFVMTKTNERNQVLSKNVVSRAPLSCQFVSIAYYISRREPTRSDSQCRSVVYILPGRPRVIVIAVICDVRFRNRRLPFVNFFVFERHPIYNRMCWCLAFVYPNFRVVPV